MQQPLDFTPAAVAKVLELMLEEGDPALKLRAYVTGGGCSGFQYGFAFEASANDDDTVVTEQAVAGGETYDVMLLVDPVSFQYLAGAEIDYVSDLDGERFVIRNPNAGTTCGCGSSFSID